MRPISLQLYTALALVLGGLTLSGQAGLLGCTAANSKPLPEKIAVFFSNETENELYRCGCVSNQMGGLSRRATVMAQQEAYPELVVDSGNFSARRPGKEYDEFKLDYLLNIYDMLGYSALNVGPMEFNRGKKLLQELGTATGDKLISANVVDVSGELVLKPYRIAEVDNLKVGIIGLISEQYKPNSEDPDDTLATTDPMEAFAKVWDEVKGKSDIQVVLSQLRDDELDLLTQTYPEIDLIVGGPGWRTNSEMAPWEKNGVAMARVGSRGKYVGQVNLELDLSDRKNISVTAYDGEVHALGDAVPENSEVEQVLEEFKERLRTGEVYQDIYEAHSSEQQFGYAGSIYCQECHGQIYAGQLRARHSQAFQTLAKKGEQNNPGCLECHTVGYDEPGGYAQKGSNYLLANVQCESCHGPASDHMVMAQEFKEGKLASRPTDWKIPRSDPQADACIKCHNPDNDPHWVDDVWPYEMMVEQVGCSQFMAGTTMPATATPPPSGEAAQPAVPEPALGGDDKPKPAESKPRTKSG